jgi:hypothetical protein
MSQHNMGPCGCELDHYPSSEGVYPTRFSAALDECYLKIGLHRILGRCHRWHSFQPRLDTVLDRPRRTQEFRKFCGEYLANI